MERQRGYYSVEQVQGVVSRESDIACVHAMSTPRYYNMGCVYAPL